MDTPTWSEVLESMLETRINRVHTAMPGKIIDYNNALQKAIVEPQLRLEGERLPAIPSVPIVWPLAYGQLNAGDSVLLIFCEGDIGLWRQQGESGEPQDQGRHGLHGAVAIAGLMPAGTPLAHDSGSTVLPGADVRLGEYNAVQPVIRGADFATQENAFLAALTLWVGVVDLILPTSVDPNTTALLTAISNYTTAISSGMLSTKVKVP